MAEWTVVVPSREPRRPSLASVPLPELALAIALDTVAALVPELAEGPSIVVVKEKAQ